MKPIYDQSLRVQGGTSFASAMFRYTASPQDYSRRLGEMLINKLGVSESVKIYDTETFFIIAVNDAPKILKDYYFIESKRQEGVNAYEKWLEGFILESDVS